MTDIWITEGGAVFFEKPPRIASRRFQIKEYKGGSVINKLLCWWKHNWAFLGGQWIIPKQYAVTKRKCLRCGLYQEIGQDHVYGLKFLDKEIREKT